MQTDWYNETQGLTREHVPLYTRYEVPYSEHSSFTELKEFVKVISPVNIIPSVNNDGPDSASAMVSLLLS